MVGSIDAKLTSTTSRELDRRAAAAVKHATAHHERLLIGRSARVFLHSSCPLLLRRARVTPPDPRLRIWRSKSPPTLQGSSGRRCKSRGCLPIAVPPFY